MWTGIFIGLIITAIVVLLLRAFKIRRFRKVRRDLMRGGQPNTASLWVLSRLRGVRTIINLRADAVMDESLHGLREHRIPLPPRTNVPTIEQVIQLLEIIDDPETGPIYLHCKVGADRTGFMVATIRILRDGWTYEQAVAEWQKVKGKLPPEESTALLREYTDRIKTEGEDAFRVSQDLGATTKRNPTPESPTGNAADAPATE